MSHLEYIAKQILAKCEPAEGRECLDWTGRIYNGSPQFFAVPRSIKPPRQLSEDQARRRRKASKYVMCRRIVFEYLRGPLEGKSPVMKCRNALCLNHNHMVLMTTQQVAQLASSEGRFSTPERRAAITAAKRRDGKLNPEKAADIRACATAAEAAIKHGIHKSMAARIRRGEAWAEVRGASVFTFRP